MGKLNKELMSRLVFNKRVIKASEANDDDVIYPEGANLIIIYTTYQGIYRQFSFIKNESATDKEMEDFEFEVKAILTHAIERGLKHATNNNGNVKQ